jgi:predicted 3-demethylubiquinone-9 3-methyltransferase (glyoxalase superfamily)
MSTIKQKITPFLWFDNNAEEAMNFYVSVFKNSKIVGIKRYPEEPVGPMEGMAGKVLTGVFELEGQTFMALDGGPIFKFTEAISLLIECGNQQEIDYYWNKLTAEGGEESQCGWLKDKYGLSWQVIPTILPWLLNNIDPEKASRAMQAMLQMKKIIIADLENA